MTTPTLCPSPHNMLGKGIFDAQEEAALLAAGYIYAKRMPPLEPGKPGVIVCSKRTRAEVAISILLPDRPLTDVYVGRKLPQPLTVVA